MADNNFPRIIERVLIEPRRSEFVLRPLHGVRQDRSAPLRDRTGSSEPSRAGKPPRADRVDTNSDRPKKHSTRRKTRQAISWVPEPISRQIDAKARDWKASRSKAGGMLIERGL